MRNTETFGVRFDASKRREIWRTLKKKGQRAYGGDHPAVAREVHPKSGAVVPIWRQDPEALAQAVVEIVREIHLRQGYTMTLRSLYYQLVGANYVPNHQVVYEVLSEFVSDMRLGGAIPWTAIEDRGRQQEKPYYEDSVPAALERTLLSYALDRQEGQPIYLEVMAEKDAVSNVVGPVCRRFGVPFTICRGFNSTSAVHDAYERFVEPISKGRLVKILYLGDHDPSGIQMREDLKSRLSDKIILGQKADLWEIAEAADVYNNYNPGIRVEYNQTESGSEYWTLTGYAEPSTRSNKDPRNYPFDTEGEALAAAWVLEEGLEVVDVALTLEQVRERNLPPNPAKQSDSNFDKYLERFGTEESWELDALPYKDLEEILSDAIKDNLDDRTFRRVLEKEAHDRDAIRRFIENYKE